MNKSIPKARFLTFEFALESEIGVGNDEESRRQTAIRIGENSATVSRYVTDRFAEALVGVQRLRFEIVEGNGVGAGETEGVWSDERDGVPPIARRPTR